MNQEARDVLVDAQLRKIRQTRGAFKKRGGYYCAAGVLLDELIKTKKIDAQWVNRPHTFHGLRTRKYGRIGPRIGPVYDLLNSDGCLVDTIPVLKEHYDISEKELCLIEHANDAKKWSFLEIARKIGVKEEQL